MTDIYTVTPAGAEPPHRNAKKRPYLPLLASLAALALSATLFIVVMSMGGGESDADDAAAPSRDGSRTQSSETTEAAAASSTSAGEDDGSVGSTAVPVTLDPTTTVTLPPTSPVTISPPTSPVTISPPAAPLTPLSAVASNERDSLQLRCGGTATYVAANLIDGDPNTGWGASSSDGTGQTIRIDFGRQVRLTQVAIAPGYLKVGARQDQGCRSVSAFPFNRRITGVTYQFDGGASTPQSLSDTPAMQAIPLDVVTSAVTIRIDGTVRWGTDDDTIISDVQFTGAPA